MKINDPYGGFETYELSDNVKDFLTLRQEKCVEKLQ